MFLATYDAAGSTGFRLAGFQRVKMIDIGRRDLLKSMAAVSALSLLASCDALGGISAMKGGDVFFDKGEMRFLSALADTIIPATETPGALAAQVPATIQQLLSSWASEETRGNWRVALTALAAELDQSASGQFADATAAVRAKALGAVDAAIYADPKHKLAAYREIKKAIGTAYYMSEIGATQELQYMAVPGAWKANEPVSTIGKNWAT
jgi:gluconate 2-dehydrogenase gamma chain